MTGSRTRLQRLRRVVRPYLAVLLIGVWVLTAVTGYLLWVAPEGRQSGRQEYFLGLTKEAWGDIHLWVSVAVAVLTAVHLVVDWRALRNAMRHLMHPPAA